VLRRPVEVTTHCGHSTELSAKEFRYKTTVTESRARYPSIAIRRPPRNAAANKRQAMTKPKASLATTDNLP